MSIPLDKLRAVKRIICHGPFCADGRASAMILKQALPYAEVEFMNYNDPRHIELEAEPGLLFCDFSPFTPKVRDDANPTPEELEARAKADERVREMVAAGAIALDHHGTQKRVIDMFGDQGVYGETEDGISGAVLAFQEVWDPICREELEPAIYDAYRPIVREFARIAGIRDTWRNKHEDFIAGCEQREGLLFWDINELLELAPPSWAEKLAIGPLLWANHQRSIRKFLDRGIRYTTDKGTRVCIAPGLAPTSDAAEMLDSDPPEQHVDLLVGFGYTIEPNAKGEQVINLVFSMRSHTGYRCDLLAKSHGGGGHKPAAGFSQAVDVENDRNPYKVFRDALGAYEAQ